jgi:hypothetical protein
VYDAYVEAKSPAALLKERIPALVFVLVPALLILPQLGAGRFLFGHDVTEVFYSTCGVVGRSLREGRLPVWDPHVMGGMPLLAGMQYGVLYPPTWLCAVFAPGAFWTLSAAFHMSLCGFFAWSWLVRGLGIGRWGATAGAVVLMLSGFVLSHVLGGHLSLISACPWIPAILWRLERLLAAPTPKRAALLALAFLLLILAGHPHTAMIGGVAVAARLVHFVAVPWNGRKARARRAGVAIAAFLAGGLLAAPQLLPTAELTSLTQRSGPANYDFSASYSLPLESLVTLVAPTFFGDSTTVPYWGRWFFWEVAGFCGISTLALAALGALGTHPQRRLWAGAALAGLILAMGQHTPIFRLYFNLVPGAGLFRVPARYLFLSTLALLPLVGHGFDRLWTGDDRVRRHATGVATAALTLLVSLAGLRVHLQPESRWPGVLEAEAAAARGQREELFLKGPKFAADSRSMALNSLLIAGLGLAAVAAALFACRRVRTDAVALGLGVMIGAELLAFDSRLITDHPVKEMEWPAGMVEILTRHPQFHYRVATIDAGDMESVGKCRIAGIDHIGGYDPAMLRSYLELMRAAAGIRETAYSVSAVPARPGPITDLLGARYWLVPGPKQPPPGWGDFGRIGDLNIYENPHALRRGFLVGKSLVLPGGAERLGFLAGPSFAPGKVVVLESGASSGEDGGDAGTLTMEAGRAGFYEFRADCRRDAWLVLAEAHYPGWTVDVDGAPAELLRADHFVQAVKLTPGVHTVRFEFRSRSLKTGTLLAAVTLIAGGAALLTWKRRRRA